MTVRQMRARMSSVEWNEWRMYYARRNQREELEIETAKAKRK